MDSIDNRILELLMRNARMDNRSIAKAVGTSDRTVARRIKRLEADGIIQSYTLKLGHVLSMSSAPADQQRVNASVSEWESIRASLTSFFGSGAAIVLFHIGYGIGNSLGTQIQSTGLKPSSQLFAFAQMLEERGWGNVDIRHMDFEAGSGTLAVVNSPFKQVNLKGPRGRTGCDEVKGMITGFLEFLFAAKMIVTEVKCMRQGHTYCEFKFKRVPQYGD